MPGVLLRIIFPELIISDGFDDQIVSLKVRNLNNLTNPNIFFDYGNRTGFIGCHFILVQMLNLLLFLFFIFVF